MLSKAFFVYYEFNNLIQSYLIKFLGTFSQTWINTSLGTFCNTNYNFKNGFSMDD